MRDADETSKRIGATVRRLREAQDMTQDEVGTKIGLSRSAVANIEAGRQSIGADTLVKLAAAFGVNVAYLCGQAGAVPPISLMASVTGIQRRLAAALGEQATVLAGIVAELDKLTTLVAAQPTEEADSDVR